MKIEYMLITLLILVLGKMNKSQIDDFLQSRLCVYIIRTSVLYCLSVVFRTFDISFTQGQPFLRSFLFNTMMVIVGLVVWEVAIWISKAMQRRMSNRKTTMLVIILCITLGIHGLLSALFFGYVYSVVDIVLFNKHETWQNVNHWDYDLVFGAFIFYLLILGFNGIIYYYRNWQEARLNAERLRAENVQAQYDVLKSQIDPHFFFNSLSVLTGLVYKSADLSAEYITQLSKCYRYILDKKTENLVSLKTELSFLDSYIFLIKIRHQNGIVFHIDLPEKIIDKTKVPPATLQMLVENAIKHNRFAGNDPLNIHISFNQGFIFITNESRKRSGVKSSTGVGLDNIKKRYELITDKKVEVEEMTDLFMVKIPVLK